MKNLGHYLFALIYSIYKILPVKKNKVLCIMTHDDGEGSNVSIVAKALKALSNNYSISYITKSDVENLKNIKQIGTIIKFFFKSTFDLASSEIVLLDNTFIPFAYLKSRNKQKIIQLWHGTGTIKKFGQDYNQGKLKKIEKKANKNITHLIVNSTSMKHLYAQAFAVPIERVYDIGVPKTDELLNRIIDIKRSGINKDRLYIFEKYNIPLENKLILYAPTFRDADINGPEIYKWIKPIVDNLPSEYHFALRLHPFVAKSYNENDISDKVLQMSMERDLNTLLMAADILITDYSSIVFDYSVTDKPMVFYPYDLEEFSDQGRGFYNYYNSYVPGPIAYTGEDIADIIKDENFDLYKTFTFKEDSFNYLDGMATNRLINLIQSQ
ncbi:MAG TPA: hypothetical protein GXZ90_09655 [Clostridiales bacterium]|nr:hypothetical protein [Clostridiales bacterium]